MITDLRKFLVRNMKFSRHSVVAFLLIFCGEALDFGLAAIGASEILPNPEAEARAQALGEQVRCPACSFQSINDSESSIAQAMRMSIRGQIQAGMSDQEIIETLKTRYGDATVMTPSPQGWGLLVWLAPSFLAMALALSLFLRRHRHRSCVRS